MDAVKARMLGNERDEEALLLEVIKEAPEQAAPYYDLSRLAVRDNKADKATDYIKKALALDGENKWYHEQYASTLTLHNDYVAAADEYAKLGRQERHNEDYLLKAAALYQRAGKYKQSLEQLDALAKKTNNDEDVLLQQEQLYLKMNDVEGATGVIKKLVASNPREPRWYALLAELYQNNKQPEKAKEVYAQMQQKFPNDPSLQISLATDAYKKGDTAKYRDYVRRAITNKSLDAETQMGLLRTYLQDLGADSLIKIESLSLTEQLVDQHPANARVLAFYGDVLSLNGQRSLASVQYAKAVKIDPSKFDIWQQLLYSFTERKDADSLIKYSEKAARLFPNQAGVHYLNGIGHSNKKEYSLAVKSIERAIDLQPEEDTGQLSDMYSALGDIYNSTKEYSRSDSAFEHALKLNRNNATLLNNYAYYLSERKQRLNEAAGMSKRSLEIRPNEGTFLDTYGWILYQQGKYEEAAKYIRQAVVGAGDGVDATLYEHLGAVEYRLGAADKATDAWRKAKAKGSENNRLDKMIADRKLYE